LFCMIVSNDHLQDAKQVMKFADQLVP
jgi:hypothetical protein